VSGPVWSGFQRVARAAPDRPCLEDAAGVVTRGELLRVAGGVARQLAGLRVAGRVVAVLLPRDRHLPAAILAAHATGAAYLPLDSGQPDHRLRAVLADATPVCVVTSAALRHRVPGDCPAVVHERVRPALPPPEPPGAGADRPAYLIYTSGSSGTPKGVLVGQAALGNYFAALDAVLARPRAQVWQPVSSIGFDSSVAELLWPLARGKYVCLTPNDPLSLLESPLAGRSRLGARVTHVQGTPSMARLLTGDPATLAGMRALDTLLVGGEPFPYDVLAALAGTGGAGPRVINVYGPTEATVWVAATPVTARSPAPCSIGPPIAGAALYVLDGRLHPARTGRLFIGGASLAYGYWRRGALTAERFCPDPFAADGSRMYDTGDLARVRGDGEIAVLGRVDDQVKIRGHRVELGEVESALKACPWVQDAACLHRPGPDGTGTLTAVVVPEPGGGPGGGPAGGGPADPADAVRHWLAARLPPYMIPAEVRLRPDRLPLTLSGKVDRARLISWLSAGRGGGEPAVSPPGSGTSGSGNPPR
jgi:amino acid adenylation domain-containing protein